VSQVAGAAQADQGGQERGQQQPQGLHAVRAGAEPRDHRRCLVRSLACSCRASAQLMHGSPGTPAMSTTASSSMCCGKSATSTSSARSGPRWVRHRSRLVAVFAC
jgi:hypothetical protein